jgi:hypothetical protein
MCQRLQALDGVAKECNQTGELPGDIRGVIRVDFADGKSCPLRDLADSAGEQVQLVNSEAGIVADLVGNGEVGVMQHIDIDVDQNAVEYRGPREEAVKDCIQICSDDGNGFVTNVELLNNAPLRLGEQIGCEKVDSLWWQKRSPGPHVGQAWLDAIDAENVGQPHPVQDAIASDRGVEVTIQIDVDQTYRRIVAERSGDRSQFDGAIPAKYKYLFTLGVCVGYGCCDRQRGLADLLDIGGLRVVGVRPVNKCGDVPGIADRSTCIHKGVDQTVSA